MYKLNFDTTEFLANQWQKKPMVLRQAFTDFVDPISADELAGLAMEDELASRVVLTQDEGKNWQVIQGPFEDYEQYGEDHWQLLVQAVNHWCPETQPLVEAFRFLPDWRFDDLMVSFATPEGGVGPHIDNYDVFIIQGEGRRRWRVGDLGEYRPRDGNPDTPLIDDFEPIIDTILETGDILYIPPGFPHCGVTLTPAMSYSIGMRAPSQQELFSQVADYLLDNNQGQQRFESTSELASPATISADQQQGIMALLTQLANNPAQYQTMLGLMLSQNRFDLDICEPDTPYTLEELHQELAGGTSLVRIGGLKVLQLESDQQQRLFVNGQIFELAATDADTISMLSNLTCLDNTQVMQLLAQPEVAQLLVDWVNAGFYYLFD